MQKVITLNVRIAVADLLRVMGCRDIERVPSHVREQAQGILAETGGMLQARCAYVVRPVVEMTESRIELETCPPIVGPIAGFLKPATRVAAFVLTMGDTFENKARELMSAGELLDGYAWDAMGSAGADLAADALTQHLLSEEATPDEAVTPPFSPGYCGMGLDQQEPLFQIVDASAIGVALSPTMMMHPIKSVSGLLGIGPSEKVIERGVPCQWCELTTCHMRR